MTVEEAGLIGWSSAGLTPATVARDAAAPDAATGPVVASVEALFDTRYEHMCRVALAMLGDCDLAEQVVMDAFVQLHMRWDRIRDLGRVEAYLRRAVVNGARTQRRRRMTESVANARAARRELRTSEPGADQGLTDGTVLAAVSQLPARQRMAVALYYLEDLAEEQVADALGCSIGTVKSQLSKARRTLGKVLSEEKDRD